MADPRLRAALQRGEFVTAPGVYDMISALMASRYNFSAIYVSGYWSTASYLGLPDAGLATYTDMVGRARGVVEKTTLPVIADADTGFGGLLNVDHTVRGYEAAGVTAIQMEDQEFPKKCGHTPYRRVISTDEMCAKIEVASEARLSEDFLIVARTDSRSGHGLAEAIDRGHRFAASGADIVFIEALESVEEMRTACKEIDAPLIANVANGGYTPVQSREELQDIGYAAAIFPAAGCLAAIQAVDSVYRSLHEDGVSNPQSTPLFDFREFCEILGFTRVWEFEERWKDVLGGGSGEPGEQSDP